MEERFQLVASIKNYVGREDTISWLSKFPTKYKSKKLKQILYEARDGRKILWSLEDIRDKKSNLLLEKGVTIL